ncbi:MAG: YidC/Oxa1 family membrane protein insertase [Patescibacteria group bacterium]
MGEIFNTLLIHPIINVLLLFYNGLFFLHVPYALGLAIVGLTIAIRFILYPLISAQLKASIKMQKVAPHISALRDKHKGDRAKIQQETMRLYKEHGVNPAAGCLPVLVQLPIIWALYSVLQHIVTLKPNAVVSEINKIVYFDFLKLNSSWDSYFFGVSLGDMPSKLFTSVGPIILIVPALTAFFQFVLSKMLIPPKKAIAVVKKENKESPKDASDFAASFQTQSMYIFPVMIGFFSYTLPIGLSLYWNTFTIFGIIQQYKIMGLGGLGEWIKRK